MHVSCRGKQTTLFILPSPVFQTGSPSLFVESLICRGASPSAPVDSSAAACSVPRSRLSSRRSWVRPARHSTLGEAGRDLQVFVVSSQCDLIACLSWTTSSLFTWVIGVDRGQILTSQVPPRLFSEPDADPTSQPAFASKFQVRFAKPRSRNNSALASAANGPVMAGPVASVTRPPRPKPGRARDMTANHGRPGWGRSVAVSVTEAGPIRPAEQPLPVLIQNRYIGIGGRVSLLSRKT